MLICKIMNVPLAIIDYRTPEQAKQRLKKDFELVEFFNPHTYKAIQGHPDICMFQSGRTIILAPNSPKILMRALEQRAVEFIVGNTAVDESLQNSTAYNCIANSRHIIHASGFTDSVILQNQSEKEFLPISQAYSRCNTLLLNDLYAITSDANTYKVLSKNNYSVLFIPPQGILLPPYKYGFIGGCLGVYNNTIYAIGDFLYSSISKDIVLHFIEKSGYSLVELYNGKLYDGGGIFFV